MRRRIKLFACVFLACTMLCGCKKAPEDTGDPYTIFVGTDLHYISPEMTDYGPLFMQVVGNADGKLTEHTEEIAEEFVETALREHPDAVILTGDLTFNGEKKSLEDLAEKLKRLEDAGIEVLVISGNHDIAYPQARRFEGNAVFPTEIITQKDFAEIMSDYGFRDALSVDDSSNSYVYALNENLWILALDANTEQEPGSIPVSTLQWAEEQLKQAKEKNVHVISIAHQNVLPQNDLLYTGYVINNNEQVVSVLEKGGVTLNLSGHSHIQHTARDEVLTDICTEAMSVYPLRYGVIKISGDSWNYDRAHLDILQEEARERFIHRTEGQIRELLGEREIPEDDLEEMVSFAVNMNVMNFCDDLDLDTNYRNLKGWKLWEQYGQDTFWYYYFDTMTKGDGS